MNFNIVGEEVCVIQQQNFPEAFKDVITNPAMFTNAMQALHYVCDLYDKHVKLLEEFAMEEGDFESTVTYPYVGIYVEQDRDGIPAGAYGTTISHPNILYDYYKEQFKILIEKHHIPLWIGLSDYPMSLTFINEDLFNQVAMKKKIAPSNMPCMKRIQKGLNGSHQLNNIRPLSAFHGERIGYSLNRLHHYCGTNADFFQNTVIFANYNIYAGFFIKYAQEKIQEGKYSQLVGSGVNYNEKSGLIKDKNFFNPQMPAYHLVGPGRNGVTLVNVNVGPSNIKTITDHMAVLRSHRWIMLGHCAGLRQDNKIGDYVVAKSYLRYDYVLDPYLPKHVPVSSSSYLSDLFLKTAESFASSNVYTGTVVTTCDRNWELNPSMVDEFSDAKAIAIDMESATVAGNAFRFGVDSIAFLCISDMPLHGAPKLRSMASEFYQTKIHNHFSICMSAVEKAIEGAHTSSAVDDSSKYSYCKSGPTPFR